MKIIYSDQMIDLESVLIKRGFFERLFSLSPFKKFKVVVQSVPKTDIIVNGNTIIAHPAMKKEIEKAVRIHNQTIH